MIPSVFLLFVYVYVYVNDMHVYVCVYVEAVQIAENDWVSRPRGEKV